MWGKFAKFMTGTFAGNTQLWDVIERRFKETNEANQINALIEKLFETHPLIPYRVQQFSGAKINKTGNEVRCHAMPIGRDLWVGGVIGVGDTCYKIYICEDQNADIDDATVVFFDKVKIPGTWQNVIVELLEKAVADANELKATRDTNRGKLDHERANSAKYND